MPPKRKKRFHGLYYHSSPPRVLPMNGQASGEVKKKSADDFCVRLSTIRIWMHEKDIGKLTRVLWAGQGNRLRQQASTNPRVKRFLAAVPYVMNTIKDVHQSVIDNNLESLQSLMEPPVPPTLITSKDGNGLNVIHKAAGLGHTMILEYLLNIWQDGAHETDITGKTPLHWAASAKNNMRCYTLLTQAGCDEEALDYKMKTPAYYKQKHNEIERSFLTLVPEAPRVSQEIPTDWEALVCDDDDKKRTDIKIPNGRRKSDVTRNGLNLLTSRSEANSIGNTSEPDLYDGDKSHEEPLKPHEPEETEAEEINGLPKENGHLTNGNHDGSEAGSHPQTPDEKSITEKEEEPVTTDEKDDLNDEVTGERDIKNNDQDEQKTENVSNALSEHENEEANGYYEEDQNEIKGDEDVAENGDQPLIVSTGEIHIENGMDDEDKIETDDVVENTIVDDNDVEGNIESENAKHDSLENKVENIHVDDEEKNELNHTYNSTGAEDVVQNEYNEETKEDTGIERNNDTVEKTEASSINQENNEEDTNSHEQAKEIESNNLKVENEVEETSPQNDTNNIVDSDAKDNQSDGEEAHNEELVKNKSERTPGEHSTPSVDSQRPPSWEKKNHDENGTEKDSKKNESDEHKNDNDDDDDDQDVQITAVSPPSKPKKDENENIQDCDDKMTTASPTPSLAIEGFVQGDSGDNQVQSQSAAYNDEDEEKYIQAIINAGDMEQLAALVLNGEGKKIMNRTSSQPEIQAFLNNVPAYMNKISRVHNAAKNGTLYQLQSALDRRKFAIAKDESSPCGASPLHVAVLFGHTDIVRYLAGRFPETMSAVDDDGRTPLHYAATIKDNGHFFNLLSHLGGNPKVTDKLGHTADFYRNEEQAKDVLSYKQLLGRFGAEALEDEMLSDQGKAENPQNAIFKTEQGRYLTSSLGDPLIKGLTEIAEKRPSDPVAYLAGFLQNVITSRNNMSDNISSNNTNSTALVSSIPTPVSSPKKTDDTNDTDDSPLNVDDRASSPESTPMKEDRDEHGQSMLHFSCARSHRCNALLNLIEESQIDVTYRDELYRTARDVSLQANQPGNAKEIDRYVLSLAVVGDLKPFEHMALAGYDHILDVEDEGSSIIDVSESKGHDQLVDFLNELRNLEETREELHQAIRDGDFDKVKQITSTPRGKWLIKAKNYYGRTAMHIAVLKEQDDMVEYLVNTCPDALKVGDNLERTPLHYAMGTNSVEVVSRVLIHKGAKRTMKDLKGRQPSYYFMNKADIVRLQEEEEEH